MIVNINPCFSSYPIDYEKVKKDSQDHIQFS